MFRYSGGNFSNCFAPYAKLLCQYKASQRFAIGVEPNFYEVDPRSWLPFQTFDNRKAFDHLKMELVQILDPYCTGFKCVLFLGSNFNFSDQIFLDLGNRFWIFAAQLAKVSPDFKLELEIRLVQGY